MVHNFSKNGDAVEGGDKDGFKLKARSGGGGAGGR